jgi:hypothetical protein
VKKGAGPRERKGAGRAGLPGLFSYFLDFLILFYFFSWFSTSNLVEFKLWFEFNSYALNQIKLMHQHECTNMLNLK